MTDTTIMATLDRLSLVRPRVRIWSGQRRLVEDDFQLGAGGRLPPEQVASLGSKKLLDPELLAPFHRLKKAAERECLRIGTRFLGGFAVDRARMPSLRRLLDGQSLEFRDELQKFALAYDEALVDWRARHPAFEDSLRAAAEPVDHVMGRFSFGWAVLNVSPDQSGAGDLEAEVGDLPGTVLDEVAVIADAAFAAVKDRSHPLKKTCLGPLRRIREKLDALSFLDGALVVLIDRIDRDMAVLEAPKTRLEGPHAARLLELLALLSDPARSFALARSLLAGESASAADAFEDEAEPAPPTPPVPADLFDDLVLDLPDPSTPESEPAPSAEPEEELDADREDPATDRPSRPPTVRRKPAADDLWF